LTAEYLQIEKRVFSKGCGQSQLGAINGDIPQSRAFTSSFVFFLVRESLNFPIYNLIRIEMIKSSRDG